LSRLYTTSRLFGIYELRFIVQMDEGAGIF